MDTSLVLHYECRISFFFRFISFFWGEGLGAYSKLGAKSNKYGKYLGSE